MAIPLTARLRQSADSGDSDNGTSELMREAADALDAREGQMAAIIARAGKRKTGDLGTVYVECCLCACASEPGRKLTHYDDCPLFVQWTPKEPQP
jgi:hypothetical protein